TYYISSIASPPGAEDVFRIRLVEAQTALEQEKQVAWVASIEPKEYAQNISDVSAREALTNLVLSLGATLPQGIGIDSYTQYLKDSQTLLQAIKRQPLAVSYSNQGDAFGWFLGPKFAIRQGKVDYLHTATRQTFTVSVVVPEWWSSLELE